MNKPNRYLFILIISLLILNLNLTQALLNPFAPFPAESTSSNPPASPSPSPTPSESPSPTQPSPTPTQSAVQSSASSPPAPSSSLNSPSQSPGSSANPTSSQSRAAAASSSSSPPPASGSSSSRPLSSSIVIITITSTGADGLVYTSVTSSYTPLPRPTSSPSNNESSGPSSSTWAIIGGVAGGLVGIAAVVFIVFRCTQKRFSDLDDEDVAIKWPELVNRTDDPTTLNPLAARPGVGHGIGEDDENDEKPGLYPHDIAMEPLHSDQRHPGTYDPYQAYHSPMHAQEHPGYYDPYLGPSGAQQPYPPSVNTLGYDEMGYHQPAAHALQAHPSHSSSATMAGAGHDMISPSASYRAPNKPRNLDDSYWDGPQDIPLSVVNSTGPVSQKSYPKHD